MKNVVLFLSLICLIGCSKKDDEEPKSLSLSTYNISMYSDEKQQITSSETSTWKSDNEFIASVDNTGLVSGSHVGKTDIIVTSKIGSAKCTVEIVPRYNTYKDPVLDFGKATKSDVKSKETRSLESEESDKLTFKGEKTGIIGVVYSFDTSGKLGGVGVGLSYSYTKEIVDFLAERYLVAGEVKDGVYAFVNGTSENYNMLVTLSVEKNFLMVLYLPADKATTKTTKESLIFEEIKEGINTLLNK